MKRSSILLVGSGVILVVIVAGAIYAARFASTVNPPRATPGAAATSGVATVSVPGTLTPGADLQTFQIIPAQTTASYSVNENLIIQNKPNNDAIGTTHAVQGNFRIRTGTSPLIAAMRITVDLSTLQSDSSMRDHFVEQNYLQTDTYPDATFISTSTQGLPASYSDGQTIHFQLVGNMTMHGKSNKEIFDVQGKVAGNIVTGTATSTVYMTDFGIQPPNLANIAIAQDKVLITITFTAKKA